MTGYGRGEAEGPAQRWTVELRSLNHRFLDLALNLPRHLWALEDRCRQVLKARLHRGRVEMQLSYEVQPGAGGALRLDPGLTAQAVAALTELKAAAGLDEPLRLDHLLRFADLLITREREAPDLEETWVLLSRALQQALDSLEEMRRAEGEALRADLSRHLEELAAAAGRIQTLAACSPEAWRQKILARLEELKGEVGEVEDARLAQELAFLAERRDVAEELARLESHVRQFRELLGAGGPVGRRLEFLVQEMLREVNTIGAKAGDLSITQEVLLLKGLLERLREQIHNVE
jgi:uncharacterized protein (TIGR00255 family)